MEHSPSLQTETRTAGQQTSRLSLPRPQSALWATIFSLTSTSSITRCYYRPIYAQLPQSASRLKVSLLTMSVSVCSAKHVSCSTYLTAYHSRGLVSRAKYFVWDLWCMKSQWDRFISEYLDLLLSIVIPPTLHSHIPSMPLTLYYLEEGCPCRGLRGCVMRPAVTFVNYRYNMKSGNNSGGKVPLTAIFLTCDLPTSPQ